MRTRNAVAALAVVYVLGCRTAPPVAARPFARADTLRLSELAPGVTYTYAWERTGPWAIHVVRVDRRRCRPVLEARKPGPDLKARAITSLLGADALVAVNADFFAIPAGNPINAQVTRARTLAGPALDRALFAASPAGWWIGAAGIAGTATVRADGVPVVQVNRPSAPGKADGVTLYTAWVGDSIPGDSAVLRVWLRALDGDEAQGRALVTAVDSPALGARLPGGSVALYAHGPAREWARRRMPGDTVAWQIAVLPSNGTSLRQAATEAVGGFPELLRDGLNVHGQNQSRASFAAQRHPRSAIGWTRGRRALLLVVVDGRQAPYSDGMTLDELAALFQRLGASAALNLDGGGSSTLVVKGVLVNRPSDRGQERAVGNALLLKGC